MLNSELTAWLEQLDRERQAVMTEVRVRILVDSLDEPGTEWGTLHPGGDVWPHDSLYNAQAQTQGDGSILVKRHIGEWVRVDA